ncbi:MAG: hypothetical protein L3J06_06050 [Cyclobacteriaceae bacterium]|nr:hypothetical protein [Cyclobacteriaceae bacterium]
MLLLSCAAIIFRGSLIANVEASEGVTNQAASIEEIAASIEEMNGVAEQMNEVSKFFKIG